MLEGRKGSCHARPPAFTFLCPPQPAPPALHPFSHSILSLHLQSNWQGPSPGPTWSCSLRQIKPGSLQQHRVFNGGPRPSRFSC